MLEQGEGCLCRAPGIVEPAGFEDDITVITGLLEGGENVRYGHVALAKGLRVETVEVGLFRAAGGRIAPVVFLGMNANDVPTKLGDLFEGIVAKPHAVGHIPVVADEGGVDSVEQGGRVVPPQGMFNCQGYACCLSFGREQAQVCFQAGDGLLLRHHCRAEKGHEQIGRAEVGAKANAGANGTEAEFFFFGVGEASVIEEMGGHRGDLHAGLGRCLADCSPVLRRKGTAGLGLGDVVPVDFDAFKAELRCDGEYG